LNQSTWKILYQWPFIEIFSLTVLNENLLATAATDYKINIWNIQTGKIIRNLTLLDHKHYSQTNIVLLPNGFLVSDNPFTIWDPYTGTLLKTFNGDDFRFISLVVLKNGLLASSGHDGWIKIWDLETGVQLKAFYNKHTMDLLVASNGYLVGLDSSNDKIFIWDSEKFNSNQETQFVTDFSKYYILILFLKNRVL
jgi:WD40 repeat protein